MVDQIGTVLHWSNQKEPEQAKSKDEVMRWNLDRIRMNSCHYMNFSRELLGSSEEHKVVQHAHEIFFLMFLLFYHLSFSTSYAISLLFYSLPHDTFHIKEPFLCSWHFSQEWNGFSVLHTVFHVSASFLVELEHLKN